ncbi:uncharacterized protein RJT21DRAFT_119496 [Scheffersomyces amazonensis]|uniref:uncharacterized protein n=1 Tax=Scheffersomyces amazonensis TaxID=1078765 RepID=UPI00315DA816
MESGALIEDYAQSLNDLTFNSRVIIDNLTTIAKENANQADGIINVISKRIRSATPEQRLFALYLLDSICKNVGSPYNVLLEDSLPGLFSAVFQSNDDATRTKLVSVLQTWKTAKAKGTTSPLFSKICLNKIDNYLKKTGFQSSTPVSVSSIQNKLPGNQNKMVDEIDKLILVLDIKLQENPDIKTKERRSALFNLKALLLSGSVQPAEFPRIQATLNEMSSQISNNSTPQPISIVDGIFSNLIESGLVKVDRDPIPGSTPVYTLQFPKIKYIPPSKDISTSSTLQDILNANLHTSLHTTEYEKVKFEGLVTVSKQIANGGLQGFINTNKPTGVEINLLYEAKPSKCSICGKRFTTDGEGSNRKRLHLDWHFRINKKVATNASNVQSRNWYLDDYDWVKFRDDALLEFSTTSDSNGNGNGSGNNDVKDLIDFVTNNQYVVVPSTSSNMNNRCNICRETVKAIYKDDIGEWVWPGCIKVPGEGKNSRKIVHVSCFNETNKKRSADTSLHSRPKRERV